MIYLALGLALIALLFAFAAFAKASAAARAAEDGGQDARRRIENAKEELQGEGQLTRQLVALIAEGAKPTREMILEGHLWRDVDGREAKALVERGARIVDVRTGAETAGGTLPGALLIPIDQLEERKNELPRDGRPTLIYCAGGGRSASACEFLSREGWSELHNLAGGIGAWSGPIQRP